MSSEQPNKTDVLVLLLLILCIKMDISFVKYSQTHHPLMATFHTMKFTLK